MFNWYCCQPLTRYIRNCIREFPLEDTNYYNERMIRRTIFWLLYLLDKHDVEKLCTPDLFEAKYEAIMYIHRNRVIRSGLKWRQNPYNHTEYEYAYLANITWSHDVDGYGEYISTSNDASGNFTMRVS